MERERIDLCQAWCLFLEDEPQMVSAGYVPEHPLTVNLPHTWNATDTFTPKRGYWRGVGWYRKMFPTEKEWENQRILLDLMGFFCTAQVWLNGNCLGYAEDGFTGQFFELSKYLNRPGSTNTLAVRIDNRHDPELLPGRETPDYVLYGGIYREVFLHITNREHLVEHGVTFRTGEMSSSMAECRVSTEVAGLEKGIRYRLRTRLVGPDGACAAETISDDISPGELRQRLKITSPCLWSPNHPSLYTLVSILEKEDSEKVVDRSEIPVGIRHVEFQVNGDFRLNGEKVFLKGVNRHQDFGGLGNAVPKRLQIVDAELIKKLGGNFVRLSHYPQHPAFLNACDRLGILVYAEIASWQHVGGPRFTANAEAMMRAMIRRDKNHPSIVLWGLLNEGRSKALFERLNTVAHECDPTRLTIYAENEPEEGTRLGAVNIPDALGLNYKLPHLDEIRAKWPDKRILSSEHTNADYCKRGAPDLENRYVTALDRDLTILEEHPFMAGGAVWSFHDYATDYRPTWPHHFSGVVDHVRLEKEAAHLLRAWWRRELMAHIMGHWTYPGEEGRLKTVRVISNTDSVELYLNETCFGKSSGNHVFEWKVPYHPGRLLARAYRGEEMAEAVLETAGPPDKLVLGADPETIRADGRDVALVTVRLADSSGRLVPEGRAVALERRGPGILRTVGGLPIVEISAGIGRFVVQSTGESGRIVVRTVAVGLSEGQVVILASSDV